MNTSAREMPMQLRSKMVACLLAVTFIVVD